MRVSGFDWDRTNRRKLALHDLEPDDVEELFESGEPLVLRRPASRFVGLGFVPDGRFILVVFEYDTETRWIRVVTAYEPTNPGWWKQYAKAKGLES